MKNDSLDSDMSPPSSFPVVGMAAECPRVLLVCGDPHWIIPVREAAAAVGGVVETVSAREALARLASPDAHYSHVLVHRNDDGLMAAVIDLASDLAETSTTLLLLGGGGKTARTPCVVASPSREAIAASLAARHPPVARNTPLLPVAELLEVARKKMIDTRYQPIVRIADRAPVSLEVLARLDHPTHGPLTPDWFVPRFEDSGFGFVLTDLVSARAFDDHTGPALRDLGLSMALNYPLGVLSHRKAASGLDLKCELLNIPASRIVIELTESRPVEDFATLGRSMEQLRALGYRIAIDDVGPAVKNLERLLTLPFTSLKLDKGIVRTLGAAGPAGAYAPRVIERALACGLTIVAEGVETEDTWERLRALGVQEVQGYLVARPLPAAAVPIWLETWRDKGRQPAV